MGRCWYKTVVLHASHSHHQFHIPSTALTGNVFVAIKIKASSFPALGVIAHCALALKLYSTFVLGVGLWCFVIRCTTARGQCYHTASKDQAIFNWCFLSISLG